VPLTIGGGIGGLVLMTLIYLLGGNERAAVAPQAGADDDLSSFVGFVLDDVQSTWKQLAPNYRPADLVLFTDATATGCGYGSAASGPFYCPRDEKVYIDLAFYRDLRDRFGAPGDFAQAYVIAHEIGHHVQRQSRELGEGGVDVELQADCYAGVWARSAASRDLVEAGDFREALGAAAAVGDDRLQRQSGRAVNPESWTHGSSEQRAAAFARGLESGDPNACDFAGLRRS
jgi:uncharacterized protein